MTACQSSQLRASAEDIQNGTEGQVAAELILGNDVPLGVYFIAIKADRISRPGMLDLYTLDAELEFPVAEHSLGSPADAYEALAVGATEVRDDSLASYSSQGPSNDGRLKPELSGPAGVSSASYAPGVFDGTSASTPHVAGAAALVARGDAHPAALKDRVTSPAGTTIEGIAALESAGFRGGVIAAVTAAAQRSAELGRA